MKTKNIILLIVILILSVSTNLSAMNPKNTIVYHNISINDKGIIKEYINLDKETSKVIQKTIFSYDQSGKIISKTIFTQNDTYEWIGDQKYEYEYEYEYNKSGILSYIILCQWNKKLNNWHDVPEYFAYIYNQDGSIKSIKQSKLENKSDLVLLN